MAETNRSSSSPSEYMPLYTIPRSEPSTYNLAELADAQSSSNSSGGSSYTLCNHTNCDCAAQQQPHMSSLPVSRPQDLRVRSAPAPQLAPWSSAASQPQQEAATSSGSTGSNMYRTWHVAEYNMEYAAWRAIERRRIASANSDDSDRGWWSWFPCFPCPSSSRPTSIALDNRPQGESRRASPSQEPVSARMAIPTPRNDGNDERVTSDAAESHTMDITCSVSRYVIKFPERQDQATTAGSSSRHQGRAVTVETAVDSGEEQDEDVVVAEERVAAA
ncbi:hypothetical protein EDB81DRAFT_877342 [Dactylonectria macrodidyma]|uniref:Uncharacterized protein n=1 Tax=Dactylonectria macrodidyma TaxID=307937 RepID=A0A9P9FPT6_9HYPO|nr:hypothetical protein EDB81DRAFT_877342 [Dactylonectria macrodidyma]